MNICNINRAYNYMFDDCKPNCSLESSLRSPITTLVKDVIRGTKRRHLSEAACYTPIKQKKVAKYSPVDRVSDEKRVRNNIIENMVQNNEDIDKSFDAFFTAWLKHKSLSINSLSGDEVIEEKKDVLYDLFIRGIGFDKKVSVEKLSENSNDLDYYTSHFDEIQRMDVQFKKLVESGKLEKWGSVKQPLYRGGSQLEFLCERKLLRGEAPFDMGTVNREYSRYGKGLYVGADYSRVMDYVQGSFAKIEISDDTPFLDNTDGPSPARMMVAEKLRIQNSENSGDVTAQQLFDAHRYVSLYSKEPIIVVGEEWLQFYTIKSPYIITGITTTDVAPICKEALEHNGFPEPISVQELENGTYGPVKGRPKKFKRTCVPAGVQKTTMVARGYWNDQENKAEDLPLLIHKKTIFERITGIPAEHEHKYFAQSPDDKQSFLSAKRSTFNHEVYILEPE